MDDAVDVVIQPRGRYVVARLSGALSWQTAPAVRRALVELLPEAGCVAVDLSGLRLRDPGCVAVFAAALEQAGGWPHAKLALFGADPVMLAQLRCPLVRATVPVADGLDAALAAADRPPGPAWPSGITAPDEERISRVLAAAEAGGGLARFVRDWLGVLLGYDSRQRSQLVRTLSMYLDRGCDYDGASRALGVHRSTVRYRVQRIRELTRLDLDDPDTRVMLQAALQALVRLGGAS
ncbi:helix-turn-helix domain-containing protein [Pseudonocardia acidicola]|uniref:STAS domain-containing protein n=1 Tax=Pseudonocardia acidicola TaxID=2724939 RepID=A0ABX1S5C8_9PSEU|nr:helix-turn-helix domain-containing protein [Pseudonocardia acidicola]NMH96790.1 STAS domain-containing protein [Pseudonocardia acidicola]